MNAFLEAAAGMSPAAAMVLIEASVILLGTIAVQPLMRRLPAARHALLLLALITVGLCPAILVVGHHTGLPTLIPAGESPVQIWIHQPETAAAVTRSIRTISPHAFPLGPLLLLVWMEGVLVGIVRLIRGWQTTLRIRKAAQILPDDRIARALDRVAITFKRPVPAVRVSEVVVVPMAGGCYHPVVLLPASLVPRLDDSELLQVLVHECAHVFRRDMLVKVYQRFLAAMLWFHPLVHIANRSLDSAREGLCDNYVLHVVAPAEYCRTLLVIAESLVPTPEGLLAPTLVRSAANLQDRIAKLLDTRRCVMTNLKSATVAVIAATFIGGMLTLSSMTASPTGQDLPNKPFLSHIVNLGSTPQKTDAQGDMITVESVRGTSDTLSPGNTYEVRGIYKLVSAKQALLSISVTVTDHSKPIIVRDQNGRRYMLRPLDNPNDTHQPLPDQTIVATTGEGHFALRFHMWGPGNPHVSFYPIEGGQGFVNTYFLTEAPR